MALINNENNMTLANKTIKIVSVAIFVLAAFTMLKPAPVHAFKLVRLIDPLCLTCQSNSNTNTSKTSNYYNNVVDSYNTTNTVINNNASSNSNHTPTPAPSPRPIPTPAPSQNNSSSVINNSFIVNNGSNDTGSNSHVYNRSTYYDTGHGRYDTVVYQNNNYPNNYPYNYNNNYNNQYVYPGLTATCYASQTSVNVGNTVTWIANVVGGAGNYAITWNGTDSLYGYGSTVYKTYNNAGSKYASITVSSGNQTITQSCTNSVSVYDYNYNQYQYYYPTPQPAPVAIPSNYYNNYTSYPSGFQIACYPDKVSAKIGSPVTWAVEVLGGSGNYSYSWTGTDGLSSTQSSVVMTYGSTGSKSATVTVNSNGQSMSQACGSTVTIVRPTIVKTTPSTTTTVNQNQYDQSQYNQASLSSLFSLHNVPWGWVVILVILVLIFTVIYLIANRNKI